jgi:predicted flap endonuclease-1-like 5' DNA nuclease
MFDVVRDILLCLLAASVLGAAIGWFARGLRARRLAASEASASRHALQEAKALLRVTESARAGEQRELSELQTSVDFARRQAETLQRELKEAELGRESARKEASEAQEVVAKLSSRLQEAETAREKAKVEVDAQRTAVAGARLRIVEVETQADAVRQENERLKKLQVSTTPPDEPTRQRLETLKATLQAAETGWDAARAHTEAAFQQLNATQQLLAASEVERDSLATRLLDAQVELATLRSLPEAVQAPPVQPARPPDAVARSGPVSKAERDDLKKIKGIGPAVERTLHRAGIYRYAQIASWTREDILAIGEKLPGFKERIVRDRWTTAARRLHVTKYGSPP